MKPPYPTAVPLALLLVAAAAVAAPPPADQQIAAAVAPAPADQRDSATVLGYGPEGSLEVLHKGQGDLVCLADDPTDERFHVACYHRSLEPFMARGRELRAGGAERDEVLRIREEEIEAGTLAMPEGPTALYSLTGPLGSYRPEGGGLSEGNRVTVLYIPYATAETTGLPTEALVPGGPWIMSEGKPWAHVMVVQAEGEAAGE